MSVPEEVAQNIFQIVVPLPNSPLKAINSYVIMNSDRPVIVDTGMNRKECEVALRDGLDALGLDPTRCDYFITHMHSDHIGLVAELSGPDSTVYFNQIEADMIAKASRSGGFGSRMMQFAHSAGFSKVEVEEGLSKHPGLRFHMKGDIDFTIKKEGDRLQIGEYDFEVIETPGHSTGHLCLYDSASKLMVAGDHVLQQISPNISAWGDDEWPLGDYLRSLKKVRAYDVELGLPGHRTLLKDFRGRVDELIAHHKERLEEVRHILDDSPISPYDVAARMKWDIKYDTWQDVGIMQKWFATGEAIAHLRHLEEESMATGEIRNGVWAYSPA